MSAAGHPKRTRPPQHTERSQRLAAPFDEGPPPVSTAPQAATVRADTAVDCARLDAASFERVERERPALAIRMLRNMLQVSAATAVQLTAEVTALEG